MADERYLTVTVPKHFATRRQARLSAKIGMITFEWKVAAVSPAATAKLALAGFSVASRRMKNAVIYRCNSRPSMCLTVSANGSVSGVGAKSVSECVLAYRSFLRCTQAEVVKPLEIKNVMAVMKLWTRRMDGATFHRLEDHFRRRGLGYRDANHSASILLRLNQTQADMSVRRVAVVRLFATGSAIVCKLALPQDFPFVVTTLNTSLEAFFSLEKKCNFY